VKAEFCPDRKKKFGFPYRIPTQIVGAAFFFSGEKIQVGTRVLEPKRNEKTKPSACLATDRKKKDQGARQKAQKQNVKKFVPAKT
jgi:hypothetical protein